MNRTFRIISLVALVLALGVSCNKDRGPGYKYPILFSCLEPTRAETTIDDIKANDFEVYAYFEANAGASRGQFEKDVYYYNDAEDPTKSGWRYDGVEYWLPGATYYFKAFYPKGVVSVDNTTRAQSFTIVDYDVQKQSDILVAENGGLLVDTAIGAPASGSEVALSFQHLLSCVVVAAKTKINGVTVESISFKNIAQTATFENGLWSSEQTTDLTKESNVRLDSSSAQYKDVSDGGFLLVPQVINGGQKLVIKTSNKDYDIVIPAITWEGNKRYTYTLTIEQDNILFSEPTIVEVWDETNATGSVIIK